MGFSTFPNNPFPPSTAQFDEGKNDAIQAEIDAIKDGINIDSFADVESALALKANSADMTTALATKTNLSNIAPAFDATSGVYAVEDKVIYDGVLYEFTSAHSTAGEWDESEVQPVKVSELIDSLKSGLTGKLNFVMHVMADNATVNIYHHSMVIVMTDRGGLYFDGNSNRGLQALVPSEVVTVTHVDSTNLTVTNNLQYGTDIIVLSDSDITISTVS